MKKIRFQLICFLLAGLAFLLNSLSRAHPDVTLRVYSNFINRYTIMFLSRLTGFTPYSIMEWVLYAVGLALIGYVGYTLFRCVARWRLSVVYLGFMLLNLGSFVALVYTAFILLWGLNYNRPTLDQTLGMPIVYQDVEALEALYLKLMGLAEIAREEVEEDELGVFTVSQPDREIFKRAYLGFEALNERYPFFGGRFGHPKIIVNSYWMTYTFIIGIYTPFTGEANVNVHIPDSSKLFTAMHEIAHQRGIAFEDEANFVAFLTAIHHPDPDYRYSGYLNGMNYVRVALAPLVGQEHMRELNLAMPEGIRRDLNARFEFWDAFRTPVQETFRQINNSYLQFNGVEAGVRSYGLVVDLLLAWGLEVGDQRLEVGKIH